MLPPNDSELAVLLFETLKLVDHADIEVGDFPSEFGKVQKTCKVRIAITPPVGTF